MVGIQGAGINSKIKIKVKYPLTWCRYTGTVNKKNIVLSFFVTNSVQVSKVFEMKYGECANIFTKQEI